MLTLSPAERRDLRARAHRLHPVVSVGRDGLTAPVLHEIDVNLLAHELVKVRVFNADRDEREIVLARICTELEAAAVQHIGKLLVVWRPAPPPPEEPVPARAKAKGKRARRAAPGSAAGARRRSAPPRGGSGATLTAAKSTPRARRPREPAPRTPARPPAGSSNRQRTGPPVEGGRRRRRGSHNP
ncbi:MAG TPA: YhbY family RNA-binding protein [Casimicrobiaceae bacterium]|jgi:putative YhbY family RNA-binding protein|nr:YhbY family RNA-binding protein [Casimicrobiaceae bacterium]